MAGEYPHYLVPIDCTPDAQRHALRLAEYIGSKPCKLTLAAVISPSEDAESRRKRIAHAQEALQRIGALMHQYGIYTYERIVEGSDHAAAFAQETYSKHSRYDQVILGAFQTRPEDWEAPCQGSLADRISQHSRVPVVVLPFTKVQQ